MGLAGSSQDVSSSQLGLDGKRPIDLLATESGRELVEALLLRMEFSVYTY
ncbi:antitoxin Xre/MbcA/ParS toxin-binding domain-containing protein [Steroidobacter sp.]